MAHGIEARVPFLDHELVEYALQIPPHLKIRKGISKYILRQYSKRVLPPAVASRPKMPFYVPVENYLSNPMFLELINDTLSAESIRARGLFRPEAVARLRQSMNSGEFLYVKQVVSLMILELWFRIFVDRRGVR